MNAGTVIAIVVGALAVVGIAVVLSLAANEAQRTAVERQQSCVEAGGSYVDGQNLNLCVNTGD